MIIYLFALNNNIYLHFVTTQKQDILKKADNPTRLVPH